MTARTAKNGGEQARKLRKKKRAGPTEFDYLSPLLLQLFIDSWSLVVI
jgi:hypothetical protein